MGSMSILVLVITGLILLGVIIIGVVFKLVTLSDNNEYSLIRSDSISPRDIPHEFLNDEESLTHLAEEYDFTGLSPEEQASYLKGQEFAVKNKPNFQNVRGKTFTKDDDTLIRERGINAFEFDQEADVLQARYLVADKTEIYFQNNSNPYSTCTAVLNYPMPVKNRIHSDIVYFEVKIFEFDSQVRNAHFSIGLVTKPYPSTFRLPGYNNFSIGYESTGNLKINKPFPTPLQQHNGEQSKFNALVLPPLEQSDVVGFGYHIPSGTIFITRNGKKIMDVMKGCFIDLYPAVGCFLTNAKFQTNIGQLGYVWIEANVKKYSFVPTNEFRRLDGERGLAALPEYGNALKSNNDKLLDKGEELPPGYPEDELDFFGRSAKQSSSRLLGMTTNEKSDDESKQEMKISHSESKITSDSEEIMDLRERLYEQTIANDLDETTPLMSNQSEILPPISSVDDFKPAGGDSKAFDPVDKADSSKEATPTSYNMADNTNSALSEEEALLKASNSNSNDVSSNKSKAKKKKKSSKKKNGKKNKKK